MKEDQAVGELHNLRASHPPNEDYEGSHVPPVGTLLSLILALKKPKRGRAISDKKKGTQGRARKGRADRGRPRIPPAAYDFIVCSLLVLNPATTSAAMVHRMLIRAVPQLMTYTRAGKRCEVSVVTVQRIRSALHKDPAMRIMLTKFVRELNRRDLSNLCNKQLLIFTQATLEILVKDRSVRQGQKGGK